MRYLPQSDSEVSEMLGELGLKNIDELFSSIPKNIRASAGDFSEKGLSESEVLKNFCKRASKNSSLQSVPSFLGAGAYNHYVPLVVDSILLRSEFYTAYTPYQPELSQGTLQAIYEFQTMMAGLTGMDAANASLYDGASATAEAVLMAQRVKKGSKVLVAKSLNPLYHETLKTYTKYLDFEIVQIGFDAKGRVDLSDLKAKLDDKVSSVVIARPNFFGAVEDIKSVAESLPKEDRPLLVSIVSEALSLAVLENPRKLGADIVAGEARSFGNPIGYGGPALGFLGAKKEYMRQMPGRIAGETKDKDGRRGFVLTLTTREQHIRREKATSNICTNEGLCMLAAAVYLSLMGRKGLKKLAEENLAKGEYLKKKMKEAGVRPYFDSPTFNEVLFKIPLSASEIEERLSPLNVEGGLHLEKFYGGFKDGYLLAVTELTGKDDIDKLVKAIGEPK